MSERVLSLETTERLRLAWVLARAVLVQDDADRVFEPPAAESKQAPIIGRGSDLSAGGRDFFGRPYDEVSSTQYVSRCTVLYRRTSCDYRVWYLAEEEKLVFALLWFFYDLPSLWLLLSVCG